MSNSAASQLHATVDSPEYELQQSNNEKCTRGNRAFLVPDIHQFPVYKALFARANRFLTDDRCHLAPRAGRTPRALRTPAISLKVVAPAFWIAWTTGIRFVANSSATCAWAMRPSDPAIQRFVGLPSFAPPTFFACNAAIVRSEISRRSFSARAAYRCSMNGSASRPSSATMNGTL
jgi:hypothetical protein